MGERESKMENASAFIRIGIAASQLGARIDSKIVFVPPEKTFWTVMDEHRILEHVHLKQWSNGAMNFYIGYSVPRNTLVIREPFSRTL